MSSQEGRVILVGCGGHARSVADVLLHNAPEAEVLFWDENVTPGELVLGYPALKDVEPLEGDMYVLAIGDNGLRRERFLALPPEQLMAVISDLSHIGLNAEIGCGCFVAHSASIGPEAQIGDNTIINTAAVVEHEVVVGAHCHVAPGTVVCGRTTIGDEVFLGVGSRVLDGIHVCDNVTVGAGGVVCGDIDAPGTYVGCPAKRLETA